MRLHEGGNIFKTKEGQPATTRINLADIAPTIQWLDEIVPGLELANNMLGSTGQKPTSGDLDLAIDANAVSKEQVIDALTRWAQANQLNPNDFVKKSGASVHFKTPIRGDANNGFVQTDLMFFDKPNFAKFYYRQDPDTEYKGMTRAVLLNSIAKTMGMKIHQNIGLVSRENNELVSDDANEIAKILLNPAANANSLGSVEKIMAALRNDPQRDQKVGEFLDYMNKQGTPYQESIEESDVNFLAKLRDRIVNQGMTIIVENELVIKEAEARIPHLEDLVFDLGSRGIDMAMQVVGQAAKDTAGSTTIKWDGKPAIIFGRKADGKFVLTDKSGFMAKGYDGQATSPQQLAGVMNMRQGDRTDLIRMYTELWPQLEAATPANFRGFIQGDLLYAQPLVPQQGLFVFQPNTIEYRIPVDSAMGKEIAGTTSGVAVHTFYQDAASPPQALKTRPLQPVQGLFIGYPGIQNVQNLKPNVKALNQVKSIGSKFGAGIQDFMNPQELRARQITDLPALMKKYVNSRVTTNFDKMAQGFPGWVAGEVSDRKYNNIIEWIKANKDGYAAVWSAWASLMDVKMDLLRQLNAQVPGQEGFVVATPAGRVKLVSRLDFSAANRLRNQ